MIETGKRFTYSLYEDCFFVTDVLSGENVICRNGSFEAFTCSKDDLMKSIQNVIEALTSYMERRQFKQPVEINATKDAVTIREEGHFKWTIVDLNGYCAVVENGFITCHRKFNTNDTVKYLNNFLSQIIQAGNILTPEIDIVRRIADAKLLVWVHEGHSIVVYESGVKGMTMVDCLVDGVHYPVAVVSVSETTNTTTLFTPDLKEIITYPLDDSIKYFYTPDEEIFD